MNAQSNQTPQPDPSDNEWLGAAEERESWSALGQWLSAGTPQIDTEQLLSGVQNRLQASEPRLVVDQHRVAGPVNKRRTAATDLLGNQWLRLAAVLAIVFLSGWLVIRTTAERATNDSPLAVNQQTVNQQTVNQQAVSKPVEVSTQVAETSPPESVVPSVESPPEVATAVDWNWDDELAAEASNIGEAIWKFEDRLRSGGNELTNLRQWIDDFQQDLEQQEL